MRNGSIVEIEVSETMSLQLDYDILSDLMKVIKNLNCTIVEQHFGEDGNLKINVPLRQKEKLLGKLTAWSGLGKKIKWKID